MKQKNKKILFIVLVILAILTVPWLAYFSLCNDSSINIISRQSPELGGEMQKIPNVLLRGINFYGNEEILFANFRKFFEEKNFQVIIPKFKEPTMEKTIKSLRQEIKKQELTKFILVGFSFGGLAAQMYSAKYPDEILALVLINSIGKDSLMDRKIVLNLAKNLTNGVGSLSLSRTIKNIFYGENFSDAEAAYYGNINMRCKSIESVWLIGEIFFKGVKDAVIDKNIPILAVIGQKDNILVFDYAIKSAKKINAEYFIIPNAGHSLPLEPNLWRVAAEKIYEWIDKIPFQ